MTEHLPGEGSCPKTACAKLSSTTSPSQTLARNQRGRVPPMATVQLGPTDRKVVSGGRSLCAGRTATTPLLAACPRSATHDSGQRDGHRAEIARPVDDVHSGSSGPPGSCCECEAGKRTDRDAVSEAGVIATAVFDTEFSRRSRRLWSRLRAQPSQRVTANGLRASAGGDPLRQRVEREVLRTRDELYDRRSTTNSLQRSHRSCRHRRGRSPDRH